MIILLVGLAFLILSFSSYALAYQINGINRVVMTTPISIFESSIEHDLTIENPDVNFSKKILIQILDRYYSLELSKFTDDFSYEIYFFNKKDGSMCIEDECEAVEITFDATLIYQYQYHRVQNYEVFKANYGA